MIGNESSISSGAPIPRPPLMPHMREGVHNHSSIKNLPQFPQLLRDVQLLTTRIDEAGEINAKARWERDVAKVKDDAEYENWKIRKLYEGSGKEPVSLIEPVLPVEPQPPYYTGDSWNSFVLHDLNGVSTLSLGLVSAFVIEKPGDPKPNSLSSPEAKHLYALGAQVGKLFDNTKSTMLSKIQAMDAFVTDFNASIDTIIEKEGVAKLGEYLPLFQNAKKQTKIWNIVSRSAFMLNGIKDGNYDEVGEWFHELQRTKVKVGDILIAAAKNSPAIECPGELADREVDGATGIMLFNLAKNAVVYKKTKVKISEQDGEFAIENDAKFPIDTSHLFEPMRPGKDGHTGYGLFTVRNVYGRLAGKDVVCDSSTLGDEETDKVHTVRFSLKKSLPVSSESPLPQPAQ